MKQFREFRQYLQEDGGAGEWGTDELLKKYYEDTPGQEDIDEDVPANNVGGGSIQGAGPLPDLPPGKRKRKKFAGCEVFELNSDDYHNCLHGRKKFERWSRKLNMSQMENQEIRSYAHKNPGKGIIVQDATTGIMSYLIHGD